MLTILANHQYLLNESVTIEPFFLPLTLLKFAASVTFKIISQLNYSFVQNSLIVSLFVDTNDAVQAGPTRSPSVTIALLFDSVP